MSKKSFIFKVAVQLKIHVFQGPLVDSHRLKAYISQLQGFQRRLLNNKANS